MSTKSKNGLLALDAEQASITTASVNIRVLRVGTKQLTQAVFRQLPVRDLIDDGTDYPKLLGTVWGWVNYTPPGSSEAKRQFVAQFGDELCRCPVPMKQILPRRNGTWTCHLTELELCRNEYLDDLCYFLALKGEKFNWRYHSGDCYAVIRINDFFDWETEVLICDKSREAIKNYLDFEEDYERPYTERFAVFDGKGRPIVTELQRYAKIPKEEARNLVSKNLRDAFRPADSVTEESVRKSISEFDSEAKAYAVKWNTIIHQLEQAPQLFIAV